MRQWPTVPNLEHPTELDESFGSVQNLLTLKAISVTVSQQPLSALPPSLSVHCSDLPYIFVLCGGVTVVCAVYRRL